MLEPTLLFSLLSDNTRLRCLALLQKKGELCVCDLTGTLDMVQPKISRHLALLRKAEIVSDRRDGLWIYYRLHPKLPAWAKHVIETTVDTLQRQEPYRSDLKSVCKALAKNRSAPSCCP